MSKYNKVNPDHYKIAGRVTPDELARQRRQQGGPRLDSGRRGRSRALPPWMVNDQGNPGGRNDDVEGTTAGPGNEGRDDRETTAAADSGDAGMPRRRAAQKGGAQASRKGSRPVPRQKATGQAPGRAAKKAKKSPKASGARGTPRGGKAPKARGSASRGASPQRAGKPAARKARTKGRGTTRKTQKKR